MSKTETTEQHCDNCQFYDNRGGNLGKCHAKAPITNQITGKAFWPEVYSSSWCGEWSEYVKN